MAADLDQLMCDANALAGQIQRHRLLYAYQQQSRLDLQNLEARRQSKLDLQGLQQQLAQTWTAIRQARLTPGLDPTVLQRHPKWG